MINKNLMLVAMLSMGTALTTLGKVKPTLASLTPPTTYNYSYTWNAAASEQYLNVNGVDSIPLYTRTADGAYYDYVSTFNVIDGLQVTMDFQRSNTNWQASGTSYKPDEDRIGSNATVGGVDRKFSLTLNNQTNKDYQLFVDFSSTLSSDRTYKLFLNNEIYISNLPFDRLYFLSVDFLFNIFVPAYTSIDFYTTNYFSNSSYFDAWYLKDLGISDSYQAGLDAETDGILTDYLGTDAQQIGWVLIGIAAILFAFKGGK
jgi:hypothetical protein